MAALFGAWCRSFWACLAASGGFGHLGRFGESVFKVRNFNSATAFRAALGIPERLDGLCVRVRRHHPVRRTAAMGTLGDRTGHEDRPVGRPAHPRRLPLHVCQNRAQRPIHPNHCQFTRNRHRFHQTRARQGLVDYRQLEVAVRFDSTGLEPQCRWQTGHSSVSTGSCGGVDAHWQGICDAAGQAGRHAREEP